VIPHDETFTARAEARAAAIPQEQTAKTVVLRDGEDFAMAVLPACERLDLHKVRDLLERQEIRLASEAEMAQRFPGFEVGAVPPFGPDVPGIEVVDRRLMTYNRVLCSGGDHRHALMLDTGELVRFAHATVADICED
jgi:Ala-tRNA(Pro) deacylase